MFIDIPRVLLTFILLSSSFAFAEVDGKVISLSSAQQSAMGVIFASPKETKSGSMLFNALVNVPPEKQVTISAPYAGQITKMVAGIGDDVKAGAGLAYFTSPQMGDARRQLLEANSEANLAKEALARDQILFDEGIIPEVRLRVTKAKTDNAQAMLKARQSELRVAGVAFNDRNDNGFATGLLKSPISGSVVDAFNTVGQRVEAGTLLFKIVDTSKLTLEVNTSPAKVKYIKIGDEITISARQAKAKVVGVTQAVDASQVAKIRAQIYETGSLQVGEIVSISLQTQIKNQPDSISWQIPSRALTSWKGQSIVFVLSDKGVVIQPVTLVSSDDDVAVIQAALTANSKVAISGIASLKALAQKGE